MAIAIAPGIFLKYKIKIKLKIATPININGQVFFNCDSEAIGKPLSVELTKPISLKPM
ncbi:hypothetical protein [Spiroplasma endosymbiont of Nebria brevicollis]|uniref:hypothetical protein n=1 Tax=Spiroplasma endosymbiont of Nebria brevicollis TaxID=3066284 RepID=UPI00313AFBC7